MIEVGYPKDFGRMGAGRSAADKVSAWVENLARLGYAAKGAVYLLVGGLAVAAAVGSGGQTTDSVGALTSISGSTLGRAALAVIALGLAGYTVWALVRAVRNPEHDGGGKRAFYGVAALIHASIALEAARLALSGGSGSGSGSESSAQHWSAALMQQPFGPWLLGLVGVGIALFGVGQLVAAWRVELDRLLALGSMSAGARRWAVRSGRFGIAARGVVFTIIGVYLVIAAVRSQPSEARGLDGVLDMLAQTPWLLGLIALGLAAYGVYNLVRARYRIIRPA